VGTAESGAPLTGPLHHENTVSRVAWSPDGQRLVTATADGIVRVWHLDSRPAPYLHDSITAAHVDPSGRRLLTFSSLAVRLWDLERRTALSLPVASQLYHAGLSPDGSRLVTATADGAARV
jgi:WD40 repeat protein